MGAAPEENRSFLERVASSPPPSFGPRRWRSPWSWAPRGHSCPRRAAAAALACPSPLRHVV